MVVNESRSSGRSKAPNSVQPSTASAGVFGAIGGPNEIKKIAHEVQRLFQQQMDQLEKCPMDDWSEIEWDEYRNRRALVQQLRYKLQRIARPF